MTKAQAGELITVWRGNTPIEAQVEEVYGDGDIKVITTQVIGNVNVFIVRAQVRHVIVRRFGVGYRR